MKAATYRSPMKKLTLLVLLLAGIAAADDGWKPIFNGKDLKGWQGDGRLWSVEDGVLVGQTDKESRAVAANTFLIWEGGEPADFELEFEARVTGDNNSGVQYRSKKTDGPGHVLGGYQFDLHPNAPYLAMLYEERGRGILCERGQRVELAAEGAKKELGKLPVPAVDPRQWQKYRVVARGKVLRHYVNGELAAEIIDADPAKSSASGLLGLQLHAGPPMKAEFKNIRLRLLKAGDDASARE